MMSVQSALITNHSQNLNRCAHLLLLYSCNSNILSNKKQRSKILKTQMPTSTYLTQNWPCSVLPHSRVKIQWRRRTGQRCSCKHKSVLRTWWSPLKISNIQISSCKPYYLLDTEYRVHSLAHTQQFRHVHTFTFLSYATGCLIVNKGIHLIIGLQLQGMCQPCIC